MNKPLKVLSLLVVASLVLSACTLVGPGGLIWDTNPPAGSQAPAPALPEPTKQAAPTNAPVVQPTNAPAPTEKAAPASGSTETFSYVPGGEGFGKWATDVTHPSGYAQDSCGRVWQATNLENLPWVSMFCNWATSDPAPRLQWTHPTELTITDTGTVEFELWRDHGANKASNPSPYDVANVKDSPLGLGWFAQGYNAEICVNDVCQPLNGGGVFQIGFPEEMTGHYDVAISVNGGQAHFWQGEKLTSADNWPLPK